MEFALHTISQNIITYVEGVKAGRAAAETVAELCGHFLKYIWCRGIVVIFHLFHRVGVSDVVFVCFWIEFVDTMLNTCLFCCLTNGSWHNVALNFRLLHAMVFVLHKDS